MLFDRHIPLNVEFGEMGISKLSFYLQGCRPIHTAAATQRLELIELLIDHGADVSVKTTRGFSLMHFACYNVDRDMVNFLVDRGLNTNERAVGGITPSHWLWYRERVDPSLLKNLVQRGPTLEPDECGFSPLVIAVILGQEDLACETVASGFNIELPVRSTMTCLQMAVNKGFEQMVTLLLDVGASADGRNHNCGTALHLAVNNENLKTVDILINARVDINAVTNPDWIPLPYAAWNGHSKLCELLLSRTKNLKVQDGDGDTPRSNATH